MSSIKVGLKVFLTVAFVSLGFSETCQASYFNNIFTAGHGDIGVAYAGGELELHYHFGSNAVINGSVLGVEAEVAPDQATTIVTGPSFARPAGSTWDFIGNNVNDPVWFLPQASDPLKPFLGIATEELDPADWSGGMTWQLADVDYTGAGNGLFSLWQTNFLGQPVVKWSETAGVSSFTTPMGGHDHYNFGFTAEGIYDVSIRVSATHARDGLKTSLATFRFNVGPVPAAVVPEPSSIVLLGVGAGALVFTRLRRRFRVAS